MYRTSTLFFKWSACFYFGTFSLYERLFSSFTGNFGVHPFYEHHFALFPLHFRRSFLSWTPLCSLPSPISAFIPFMNATLLSSLSNFGVHPFYEHHFVLFPLQFRRSFLLWTRFTLFSFQFQLSSLSGTPLYSFLSLTSAFTPFSAYHLKKRPFYTFFTKKKADTPLVCTPKVCPLFTLNLDYTNVKGSVWVTEGKISTS